MVGLTIPIIITNLNMLERNDNMETFYEMSVKIIGELPNTALWIYDISTIFLVICAFCIMVIPISIMFKKVIGG